jgi:hypothetical protein
MPYAVCPYCQTVVMREGAEGNGALREIGKTAVLPFDVSPIQLGTTIEADGVRFTVAGRVRWGWSDGSWNEWLLTGGSGETRWLGEAMGMYMLTKEFPAVVGTPIGQQFAEGGTLAPGATLDAAGRHFTVTDVKQAMCLGGEGDLPFPCPIDWTMSNVDFRSRDGAALSLQRDAQGTTAWLGSWYDLAGLKPVNLRAIEGWPMPALQA